MARSHGILAGLAWLVLAGGALAADDAGGAGPGEDPARLVVALEQGLLTLRAHDVPLVEVLGAIGQRAGFEVAIRGALDTSVSIDLAEIPLEEGLRQLLRGESSAWVYDRAAERARLVEVRVYGLEQAAAQPGPGPAAHPAAEASATPGEARRRARIVTPFHPLEDRLAFVRSEARAGKPSSPDDLITLLREDEDARVRALAASALGRLGGPAAGEALVDALADRNRRVRRRAVRALGEAWGRQAVAPIAELLTAERSRGVRRVAAYALSRIEGEAALTALRPLQLDRDPRVRRIAAFALEAARD